ncbi:MAG TPA: hypothetical protein VFG69_14645 [Nannocystaceae bacterium]|nr:hypothetical protein [Nannocystaceae bacterium]
MQLPAALTVPSLDPAGVGRVRRLCDAIVETAKIGLDAEMLLDSLNDTTANDFTVADVLEGAAALGSDVFAALAISPPAPRVDAPLEAWAELVRRIRESDGTRFECAWWLELLARASARDDVAATVLGGDARPPAAIAAALFAR